jgi:diguanylate cyclase (GGDEF)-like protein/PAS domain S-box-containing protein
VGAKKNEKARPRRAAPPRCARTASAPKLAKLLGHLPGMVYRTRAGRHEYMEFVSAGCYSLTGYRAETLTGAMTKAELVHPDDQREVAREIGDALKSKRAFHTVYRLRTSSGDVRWVSEQGRGVYNRSGALAAVEGYINDVTEQKLAEQLLAEQAIRDALTGLYNRRFFDERVDVELARARRNRHAVAFLMCDLDQFKSINDSRGHEAGDEVLKAVGAVIMSATRGSDLVVRWGGDEIVVVLSETNESGGRIVAKRIRQGVRRLSESRGIRFDISIGIAVFPAHGEAASQIIRLADRALYIAKKSGDRVHVGDEHYRVDEHAVRVVFQPIMDVRSHQVLGYEALSRDPEGRLSVTELFRKYHAVGQLEELKIICFTEQLRLAREARLKRIFLNADFHILDNVVPPRKPDGTEVIIEISERDVLHDVDRHLETATKWRAHGYKFAIDDFGAGFVSLPFVARLMPEFIKIDRSVVLQAVASDTFRGFTKHLLFALRTYATEGIVAKGIETEQELAAMEGIGIFTVQGLLVGRPQELGQEPEAAAA